MTKKVLNGNEALAEAMRQLNPDVVAAYPITPASHIVERFSEAVADGQVQTEFVPCESEHSAMSACVGAAASGARTMTATASQGLALMHEVLFNASGLRLPIVLMNGNRALSAPLSIHGDHSDAMAQRDTGWLQLFAGSVQEAYDLAIQAFPIAEDLKVRLPVMICFDAFDTSHLSTNLALLKDTAVQQFIGQTVQVNPLLDLTKPVSYGTYANPDSYFEHRRSQHEGMEQARKVILKVGAEFQSLTQRDYSQHFETYELEDAETVIVIMGSAAGTVREAVRALRAEGERVGLLRLRTFRPFPTVELVAALQNVKNIAVLDRTMPAGATGGPLYNELNSALHTAGSKAKTTNWIYGIGQREFAPVDAIEIFHTCSKKDLSAVNFVNLKN